MLCIASQLTMNDEKVQTRSILDWRQHAYDLNKKPTIFAIGRLQ
jgi:16S rRNA (cytidine1402-2'-O)-methyltransferase